jgi:thioredoxin
MVKLITSAAEFNQEIQGPGLVVVDFYADWCGPCKQIAPFIESLSVKYPQVKFLKVNVDQCEVAHQRGIRAMPTFQFFVKGDMVDELKGADQFGLNDRVQRYKVDVTPSFAGKGFSLGSAGATAATDAGDFRDARLKAFQAAQSASSASSSSSAPKPAAQPNALKSLLLKDENVNEEDEDAALARAVALSMVEGKSSTSASAAPSAAAATATAPKPAAAAAPSTGDDWDEEMVPVPVDEEILAQLVSMDVPEVRARKSIVHGQTLEGALAWLEENQNDPDIDQPYLVKKSDTVSKRPLTQEEIDAKVEEMKQKIKRRKEEKSKAEKEAEIQREKERRERGKSITEVQEERDRMMRKREAEKQKKEKMVSFMQCCCVFGQFDVFGNE